jgi:dienelactone hydrolase
MSLACPYPLRRAARLIGCALPALTALVLAAVLLAPTASAKPSHAGVLPPAPTGAAPVGFLRLTLTDVHRRERLVPGGGPRRMLLRVWYPASAPGDAVAPVLSATEQIGFEEALGVPRGALDGLGAPATAGARPAEGRHPVVLLSHGFGTSAALHAAYATDLASHGYVVVGVDHPGDAALVDLGTGPPIPGLAESERVIARSYRQRVGDLVFVFRRLGSLRGAGRLDLGRVAAVGHSLGGAAAAGAMLVEPRIRAGVDIDGTPRGSVVARGLRRPFGFMLSAGHTRTGDPQLDRLIHALRGPHPQVTWPALRHNDFTDLIWLHRQLALAPSVDRALELGRVDPGPAVQRQRAWLLKFLQRHLAPRPAAAHGAHEQRRRICAG